MQAGWQRWIPLTGVLFVILFIVGVSLGVSPDGSDSDEYVLNWYADSGHQTQLIASVYVLAAAGVALLLFMNRMRAVVAAAEGDNPLFAPFIFGGAVVFVVTIAVAGAALAAVAGGVKLGDQPDATNADVVRFLPQIGYATMLIGGIFAMIFAMFSTAVASMRYAIFPSWFNWLTIVCGLVLFFAAAFFPLIALAIWLIAGTWLLMNQQRASMELVEIDVTLISP